MAAILLRSLSLSHLPARTSQGISFPPSPAGTQFPDYVVRLLKFAEHSGMGGHGKRSVAMWRAGWGGDDSGKERGVPCLRVCKRWTKCELDCQRQAQAMASTKIAQARISVGNINLCVMSVIKLRRVNYLHDYVMQKIPLS